MLPPGGSNMTAVMGNGTQARERLEVRGSQTASKQHFFTDDKVLQQEFAYGLRLHDHPANVRMKLYFLRLKGILGTFG